MKVNHQKGVMLLFEGTMAHAGLGYVVSVSDEVVMMLLMMMRKISKSYASVYTTTLDGCYEFPFIVM